MASEGGLQRRLGRWYGAFRTQTALRVCLLAANLWILSRLADSWAYPTAAALAAAALAYQIFALWRYVDRTNRDLARFFAAVKHDDFSQTFPPRGLGLSFNDLNASFNQVLESFRRARAAQEEQARYLQTLVQHIGVGLLVFDGSGRVSLINPAAKRMLGVPRLDDIGALDRVGPGLAATVR